jgi:hypothetical protein
LNNKLVPGTDSFDKALLEIAAMFPTLTWVPNMAQRRIIAPWEKPPYPFMVISSCGNGVGKTDSLPQDIVGCLCGPEYLNDCWNYDDNGKAVGMIHYQYYHDVKKLRESGTFCYRLLCGPDDMKENGSLYTAIKHYIPTAKFKGKMSTGCYKQIEIPLPHNPQVKNYIDIKTFDQEVVAQAGANLHRIGINEPPPFPVWNETVARIRSKKGSVQCTILMNATILDQATWVFSLEEDPFFRGKILYVQGAIWENVVGEEITDDIANECERRLGYRFNKDKFGKYITHGHLTRESVEIQIHTFEKTDPNQVESRIWGANTALVGSEFKEFCKTVHIRPPRIIPRNVPVIQVVDPHPVKPDLCAYCAINSMNNRYWFSEWPNKPWEKLRSRDVDIAQICQQWTDLEERLGIRDQIVCRIGDPNRFKTSDSRDLSELWMLYTPHGFRFNLFINDSLEYGHQLIHTALHYNKAIWDKTNGEDPAGWPQMTFSESCVNLTKSLMYYGRKPNKDPLTAPSEQIDKTWKDAIDLIRYGSVWLHGKTYYELMEMLHSQQNEGGMGGDYAKLRASRGEEDENQYMPLHKLKGRKLENYEKNSV